MTRAEGICVCRNIVAQIEENGNINQEFAEGLHTKATGMEEMMLSTTKYPRVSDNMQRALENMWKGLRKWDRNDQYSDDMFAGLADVEKELEKSDAGAATTQQLPKGREASMPSAHVSMSIPPAKPAPVVAANEQNRTSRVIREGLQAIEKIGLKELKNLRGYASDLNDILALTSSMRTQALITAAYHSGKINGARTVAEISE
jgi:hypothetical protein